MMRTEYVRVLAPSVDDAPEYVRDQLWDEEGVWYEIEDVSIAIYEAFWTGEGYEVSGMATMTGAPKLPPVIRR